MAPVTAGGPNLPLEGGPLRRRLLLPAIVLSVMTLSLTQTIVVTILGNIATVLHASAPTVGWVVTANLLGGALSSPLLGHLADTHGRRPVMLGILAAACVGSLLAASTSSLPALVVARVLQGSTFSLFAIGVAVLRDEMTAAHVARGMGAISIALGLGGATGLAASGLLVSRSGDYHDVFWLAFGVCVLALGVALYSVPPSRGTNSGPIDWIGASMLGLTLVLLLVPLSRAHAWGWHSRQTLACLAGALLAGTGWLGRQRTTPAPLLNPGLMGNAALRRANLVGLLVGVALFVSFLGVSAFVQVPRSVAGYGFSATVWQTGGLYLLPGALIGVVMTPLGVRMVRVLEARSALLRSLVLGCVGFILMATLHGQPWQLMVGSAIVNVALSFAFIALPALIVSTVSAEETSTAGSLNSIARATGSALASALVVSLLSSRTLGESMPPASAFVWTFLIGALACGVAGLLLVVRFPLVAGSSPGSRV